MIQAQKAFIKIHHRLLWGNLPSPSEWTDFFKYAKDHDCKDVECMIPFFDNAVKSYTSTDTFRTWLTVKVDELFYLKPQVAPNESDQNGGTSVNGSPKLRGEAFDLLVDSIVSDNRPWKDLYLSQTYQFLDPNVRQKWGVENPIGLSLGHALGPANGSLVTVSYDGHPNVSGVWSTNRFLLRFWDTELNSGRKRAAQFFRIMFCDDMKPSIERKNQDQLENLLAVGVTQEQFQGLHQNGGQPINRHASQADCRMCHQRLDPAAWTFRGVRVGLASKPSSGQLVYYDVDGQLQKQDVANLHALNEAATATERYKSCQVDHFIQWVIGYDALISQKRKYEFIEKFEALEERPADFIRYLVTTPEFFTGQSAGLVTPPSLVKARGVFQNCNECHSSFPFGKNPYLAKDTILKIVSKLDMPHNFKNRKMPPATHWWSPEQEDLEAIRQWVSEGAPRDTGEPLLNQDDVKTSLGVAP